MDEMKLTDMNSEVSEFSTLVPGAEVSEMNEAKCRE